MLTNNIIYGAGVLFYSKSINQTPYFFLGKDLDNKWSNFGGRCEISDKLDPETTAARECWEESLGCVEDFDIIKNSIAKPDVNYILCKTPSGYSYYMYLVKIPLNNMYRHKFISTKKFISKISIDKKFLEINDVKWVSYDTIKHSVGSKKPLIKLRHVFEQSLIENKQKIENIIF
tara:strand:+ start:9696 stop:10220 length:525 start_codon:yes stop_codon:yes gene_type:complete